MVVLVTVTVSALVAVSELDRVCANTEIDRVVLVRASTRHHNAVITTSSLNGTVQNRTSEQEVSAPVPPKTESPEETLRTTSLAP